MKTFYETLELAMKEKGMNAADVCDKSGVIPSYMSKLKSGHIKNPTWDKALAIVYALEMMPDDFLALQRSGDGE